MRSPQYVKTGICEKFQTLLEESERALAAWNERRAKIAQSRLVGKDAGDELVRLQTKYARVYAMLWSHSHHCTFCQLVKRLEGRTSENSPGAVFHDARYC